MNIKAEIPNNIDCHAKIIDNGQKGRGKIQKKQRLKLHQKVEVAVHTNVISVTSSKLKQSDILKKTENIPSQFEEHPLFNKRNDSDYDVLLAILEKKISKCDNVKDIILNKWFKEAKQDIAHGDSVSSSQETFQINKADKIVSLFLQDCPNLRARALFNVLMDLGISVFVKHLALRLSRPNNARIASAAFTPILFLMNNIMYR